MTRLFLFVCFALLLVPIMRADVTGDQHIAEPDVMTDEVAVHIPDSAHNPYEIAKRHGYTNLGPIGPLKDHHLFKKASHWTSEHPTFHKAEEVAYFEHQVARKRFKRELTLPDPLYEKQWHLHGDKYSLNVDKVWSRGITGKGINVAIIDDGLDWQHPDLKGHFYANGSFDINYNRPDPSPSQGDVHGTRSAGTAAAASNSACGVGVAFDANIAGLRLLAKMTRDTDEAKALGWKCDDPENPNHVYSSSWGPADDGKRLEGPGFLTRKTMQHCIEKGRFGRGTIYIWAGGNGRVQGDNMNYDGYANSRYTIPIGSVDHDGQQAYYSESGSGLFAVTASSGKGRSVVTTDVGKQCTEKFGGTSASSPMVAGLVALILQTNPLLGWRDLQHIIVQATKPLDLQDASGWAVNGAGYSYSHKFGFGLLDAARAINLARDWENKPPALMIDTGDIMGPTQPLEKGLERKFEYTISPDMRPNLLIEHVEVSISAKFHGGRGGATISLISPAGTTSVLSEEHNDMEQLVEWTYITVFNWGETPTGTWSLVIYNNPNPESAASSADIYSWRLRIYGYEPKHNIEVA